MDARYTPTDQSWSYRKRAANLARAADASPDVQEQVELVTQALRWIQLAENEEFLAHYRPPADDN